MIVVNKMQNILLIDDDEDLCELLDEYLSSEGFKVTSVHDGETAIARAAEGGWDAVILDVMLPGANGFDVLKRIKPDLGAPVLMLTARGEDTDTVLGLELGADDYVAKPCSPRVLVARLRALLRRRQHEPGAALRVGDLSLDEGSRQVEVGDQTVSLTGAEFNLLRLLVRHAGEVVSRDLLAEEGLGRPLGAYDRRIETHMAQIRRKLGASPDGSPRIQTVRGSGYQYVRRG
ncbi:response regulator transcription factor [Thiohalomonas denitrificans]|uniref:Two-component system, OmpR family, response regulator CpxR n=1 Tax=Thiohalomonas denitrificans TaxID=415747 RepID=A0A1G5PQC5_9GAMM|nr:response regulator transcription factor [Thiohalomonas denitrificans]SCZ51774.1 two-component system, OmpR family, response regulator CpxR [Thiohalomonas denitrificans]